MEKINCSAMAEEEIGKMTARKNEIASLINERKSTFDAENDLEKRDALINETKALEEEARAIDEKVAQLEETRKKYRDQEERMSLIENVNTVEVAERATDVYDSAEYRSAWVNYVKTNDKAALRAANVNTTDDAVVIPTIMQGMIETAWEKYGKFSSLVKKSYVKGLLSVPYEVSADDAVWHTENGEAPAQEDIELGEIKLEPRMIKKWIALTDEIMALADVEFMRYIADELVYRVVLLLDHAIISGSLASGKGVEGVINSSLTASVSATLGFNTANEALASLKTFDNVIVAMNPQTFFKNIMGMMDTTGQPIYTVATDNTGKPKYFVNGLRVEFTEALPAYDAAGSNPYMVVGNFADGYRLNMPMGSGVQTLADPYSLATEDQVRMIAKLFVAGRVVKLGHFAKVVKA